MARPIQPISIQLDPNYIPQLLSNLQAVLLQTELGGNAALANVFSWAGGNSTYSFGLLQFDTGGNSAARQFLSSIGFSSDQIALLSQQGGLLSTSQVAAFNAQLDTPANLQALQVFTQQQLQSYVTVLENVIGTVMQSNPSVAEQILASPELQLRILDYNNQFDGITLSGPTAFMVNWLSGQTVPETGGTFTLTPGQTLTGQDIEDFVMASKQGVNNPTVESGREDRLDSALNAILSSPSADVNPTLDVSGDSTTPLMLSNVNIVAAPDAQLSIQGNNLNIAAGANDAFNINGIFEAGNNLSSILVTDNGNQTGVLALNSAGQTLSNSLKGDPGSANPDFSSTVTNTYNGDGTLAETQASDSNGISSDTIFNYAAGSSGGETGSSTTAQGANAVSVDTVTISGNTVTNEYQITYPSTGDAQKTVSVTTTNSDGSQTVNTTDTFNGALNSTETATYKANGDLVQDNVTNFQNGFVSSTSSIANSYGDNGELQQAVTTTNSGSSTDTNTLRYSYYDNGAVHEVAETEDYGGSDGSFQSQSTSVFSQDGDQIGSNNAFDGSGSFAPQPSPPGSDSGGGGYYGPGSDGSGGSSEGGGYSLVGGSSTPSGGTNSNIGVISQYDLTNGSPIAGLIAQSASNQAFAAVTASQTSSASNNPVLEGAAWDSKVVTWSFASGSGPAAAHFSNSIVSQYQASVEQAFATWGAATGITFEEVSDSSSSDIRVGWGDFQTATSGVVGYTNYRSTTGAMNGAIVRLEDPTQDPLIIGQTGQLTYEGTDATLLQVAEHEIGHALGFADNSDPSSIMYAVASSANQTFDATDLAGIAQVYGGSSTPSQTALGSSGSSDETYYNAANQLVTSDTTNPDGSTNDVSYSYNSGGSYVETAVATPSGSSTPTTTAYDINGQGQITGEQVTSPGSPTVAYTYNAAGQLLTADVTNGDGSTNDVSYSYNSDGSYVETAVATPAGGGASTTTVYDINSQGQTTSENITNPDGSTITYTYNAAGQLLIADVTNADGSTNDVSYSYNSDGSYVETAVATPAGGGAPTTTVYDINAQGQTTSENIANPDGSTITYIYNAAGQLLTDDVTNADGSTNDVSYSYNSDGSYVETAVATSAGGGASTTTVYDINTQGQTTSENITNPDGSTITYTYNGAGQLLSDDVTNADGSTNDVSYSYNGDGSYIETAVATPAGGGTPTTTVYDINAQGQTTSEHITNPDGSTITYTYNAAGQLLTDDVTNADGSTNNVSYSYNGDGSYIETAVATPAGGGAATTTVYDINAQGQITVEDGSQLRAGASSTDAASNQDGGLGTYWWNRSTREYLDISYSSAGSFWSDEYPHTVSGPTTSTGISFAETNVGSVDSGMRQFDASINLTTLGWDSARTGVISGANSADTGLQGLVNDGDLTKTQTDSSFFPNVRPVFGMPLSEHH